MACYKEWVFGFQDVEFAHDTHFANCHIMSHRVVTTCYLHEAKHYGFGVNSDPVEGKCCLIALNPDVPNLFINNLKVRVFSVVTEVKILGMYSGRVFLSGN